MKQINVINKRVCACVFVHVCVRECVRVCVHVYVRACVVCVCARERACAHVCVVMQQQRTHRNEHTHLLQLAPPSLSAAAACQAAMVVNPHLLVQRRQQARYEHHRNGRALRAGVHALLQAAPERNQKKNEERDENELQYQWLCWLTRSTATLRLRPRYRSGRRCNSRAIVRRAGTLRSSDSELVAHCFRARNKAAYCRL